MYNRIFIYIALGAVFILCSYSQRFSVERAAASDIKTTAFDSEFHACEANCGCNWSALTITTGPSVSLLPGRGWTVRCLRIDGERKVVEPDYSAECSKEISNDKR